MNIIVVGCGKVGSAVSTALLAKGHDVSLIAEKVDELDYLSNFNGLTVIGVPIDQDILIQAGIENCDSMIVLTKSDNINLMVSQIAKKIYNVENVIIRMTDESRKDYYEKQGIKTICTTTLAINGILTLL